MTATAGRVMLLFFNCKALVAKMLLVLQLLMLLKVQYNDTLGDLLPVECELTERMLFLTLQVQQGVVVMLGRALHVM
jgi:hypothetical protein